jgi:hypothetical protein
LAIDFTTAPLLFSFPRCRGTLFRSTAPGLLAALPLPLLRRRFEIGRARWNGVEEIAAMSDCLD